MAQLTSPKIEELRGRLNADPKSRLFYQLAEELRRGSEFGEAEKVLRSGLSVYPAYLAAWVSLGRVLREQKKEAEAVDALNKALQLDPSNVVAARLLADAFLELGEKREALKKYKLVHALIPADEALRTVIDRLERELGDGTAAAPPAAPLAPAPFEEPSEPETAETSSAPEDVFTSVSPFEPTTPESSGALFEVPAPEEELPGPEAEPAPDLFSPPAAEEPLSSSAPVIESDAADLWREPEPALSDSEPFAGSPIEDGERLASEHARLFEETGDAEPMSASHDNSPFEEPVDGFGAAAVEIESPLGIHVDAAPVAAEVAAPLVDELGAEPLPFADGAATPQVEELVPALEDLPFSAPEALRAGPEADAAGGSDLPDLPRRSEGDPRVEKLERWLSKVGRKGVSGV